MRKKKPTRRGAHFTPEFQAEAGRARMQKLTEAERTELARKGGKALAEQRGPGYMAELGQKGYNALNQWMKDAGYFPNQQAPRS